MEHRAGPQPHQAFATRSSERHAQPLRRWQRIARHEVVSGAATEAMLIVFAPRTRPWYREKSLLGR